MKKLCINKCEQCRYVREETKKRGRCEHSDGREDCIALDLHPPSWCPLEDEPIKGIEW